MKYQTEIKLLDRKIELLRYTWRQTENMLERKQLEVKAEELKDEQERYLEADRLGVPVEKVRKKIRTVEQAIARAQQLSTHDSSRPGGSTVGPDPRK